MAPRNSVWSGHLNTVEASYCWSAEVRIMRDAEWTTPYFAAHIADTWCTIGGCGVKQHAVCTNDGLYWYDRTTMLDIDHTALCRTELPPLPEPSPSELMQRLARIRHRLEQW